MWSWIKIIMPTPPPPVVKTIVIEMVTAPVFYVSQPPPGLFDWPRALGPRKRPVVCLSILAPTGEIFQNNK